MSDTPNQYKYPLFGRIIFWGLWLMGSGVAISLMLSALLLLALSSKGSWLMAGWNLLVVAAEGYLLGQSNGAISRHEKPMSELLWLAALAGVGVPLVAAGGCGMLSNLTPRMAG